ncbi:hypothetical protein KUTeg_011421 [Tegillarca granosa]|uniref:Uncharacterized protein n=1 Tax=Tegillarca granosa TaxID=220873 RepID=A0ABQ9F440_TEGGR|nr:hypothetical protein KUTeg_011421 [Tegillarca granosa]
MLKNLLMCFWNLMYAQFKLQQLHHQAQVRRLQHLHHLQHQFIFLIQGSTAAPPTPPSTTAVPPSTTTAPGTTPPTPPSTTTAPGTTAAVPPSTTTAPGTTPPTPPSTTTAPGTTGTAPPGTTTPVCEDVMSNEEVRPAITVNGDAVTNIETFSSVPYESDSPNLVISLTLQELGQIVKLLPSDNSNVDTTSMSVTVDGNVVQLPLTPSNSVVGKEIVITITDKVNAEEPFNVLLELDVCTVQASTTAPPGTSAPTTTSAPPTTSGPPVCTLTEAEYVQMIGRSPTADPVGFIEMDDVLYPYPTSDAEKVFLGQTVEEGRTVHIGCYECVCEYGQFSCNEGTNCECNYTYGNWSECPTECTTQTNMRFRIGTLVGSPSVQYHCLNETTEEGYCDDVFCPTTPPSWSTWSNCTTNDPCVVGSRIRERGQCNETNPDDSVITEPCVEECTTENQCQPPFVWFADASACNVTCMDYRLNSCVEPDERFSGCRCAEGLVEYDGNCVEPYQCPCYSCDGTPVIDGTTMDNTLLCETCTCTNGQMVCQEIENCCEYDDWFDWSNCTAECGQGIEMRTRNILSGNETQCTDTVETRDCTATVTCPPACNIGGQSYAVGDPIPGDDQCQYCECDMNGNKACYDDPNRVVHGNYGQWTDWSECSLTCEGGQQTRTRTCSDPMPECGGNDCSSLGNDTETRSCNNDVHCCEVTSWGTWSDCMRTCVVEGESIEPYVRERTRSYVLQDGDQYCNEGLFDFKNCMEELDPCNTTCK